jgi:transcriptional repressor NrdR
MTCDGCGFETCVKDTQWSNDTIRRRRECLRCKSRFTTYEIRDELYSVLRNHNTIVSKLREARTACSVIIDIIENDLPTEKIKRHT